MTLLRTNSVNRTTFIPNTAPKQEEPVLSPLDGRLPSVTLTDMAHTQKSPAEIRRDRGEFFLVDQLELIVERYLTRVNSHGVARSDNK